uniref:Glycoprotein hormone subunit beta 5 n=1 Tax=Chrysemys picta bellii TaxID=8478 RepID=A0A8C3I611_CHRPI
MKLRHVVLGSLPLLILAGCVSALKASNINLRTFIGCAVREFTFLARKPGCKGMRITTDACWGRCETWELPLLLGEPQMLLRPLLDCSCHWSRKPVLDPPYVDAHHRVCTYNETKLVTVKLPNCADAVDPSYTYPMAIRCDCGVCSTATTECETV